MERNAYSFRLEHDYFDGPCQGIEWRPCVSCLSTLSRHGMVVKLLQDGVLLGFARNEAAEDAPGESGEETVLRFFGHLRDPLLPLYTENFPGRMGKVLHVRIPLGGREPEASVLVDFPAGIEPRKDMRFSLPAQRPSEGQPFVVLDLVARTAELTHPSRRREWETSTGGLRLHSRSCHWKYSVLGMDAAEVEIHDLTADRAQRVGFGEAVPVPGRKGVSFITERPLPLRERAENRFQLRGPDGRVLIRRLPNARPGTVGKERLRDGQEILVAETFINP